MIEYLIRLLNNDYRVAVLSRGYKRKTSGFILASENSDSLELGDESYQIHKNFNDVFVAVDANRQNGIEKLQQLVSPDVILLDDAYQHRKVKAGYNVLLTAYDDLYTDDILLPTGNLREPKSGADRSDLIVITKCPEYIESNQKQEIINKIQPNLDQKVFFSNITYANIFKSTGKILSFEDLKAKPFTLLTGIAKPKVMVDFLESKGFNFEYLQFPDHHHFSESEIDKLNKKELIVTTEKDYVRLEGRLSNDIKLYYLPIKSQLFEKEKFDNKIRNFVSSHSQNS